MVGLKMNEHPKYYITYMKFHADAIHDSATVIHKEKMMNERIKQLAEQCESFGSWDNKTYSFDKEKFAKLIIEECAEMGDNFDGQPTGNEVRKYLTAGDAIREYFGVE
jgi:hypothetical protein